MRTLASLGTVFFLVGTFLFTRGLAGHPASLIFGAVIGLAGLFILGKVASNPESEVSSEADESSLTPRSKRRARRRSSTSIRSLRVRRTVVGAGGR